MKYSSELEMCRDLTSLISGMLIPEEHKHIPEVPRSSHNNHADMLFLFDSGKMFIVEYKLNNPHILARQVQRSLFAFGIVNQSLGGSLKNHKVFQYTGQDWELEKISAFLMWFGRDYKSKTAGIESVYYWGYKNTTSSLNGGIRYGKRLSFFELYKQAIINLQEHYNWKLDFYLTYRVLGFYEMATAKKHYSDAMKTTVK